MPLVPPENDRPGTVPVWVSVAAGYEELVKVKVKAVPCGAVAVAAVVIAGAWGTVSVNVFEVAPSVLDAVMVRR